jgi:aspartate/methionine/tyrosine aminotransferase
VDDQFGTHRVLLDTDMHIISDEMYCHSQLTDSKPEFVSALKLKATQWVPDRVHVVWGFAKDFGLSGFRAGFVISKSKYVQNVMSGDGEQRKSLAWFTPFDSLKHFYIEHIIDTKKTIWDDVMDQYKGRLAESFNAVAEVLKAHKIKFVHPENANSAQFFWLDLREFLPKTTTSDSASVLFNSRSSDGDREEELARLIHNNAQVKLLTGHSLTCPLPGYFRLCFTAFERNIVVDAVMRMCDYLNSL